MEACLHHGIKARRNCVFVSTMQTFSLNLENCEI